MAKYTRYRNYNRRRYRKSWSPNIQELLTTNIQASPGVFYATYTLATNPIQENTTVSQTYTVKNFNVDFYIDSQSSFDTQYLEDICAYIVYVPQGMTVGDNYNILHPEYILNYKYLGQPTLDNNQPYQPFRIRSRMARKLNTGDSVQLFIKGNNQTESDTGNLYIHGIIRWWTKSN